MYWYNHRVNACKNAELISLLAYNCDKEKEHAARFLEWIRRKDSTFSKELQEYVFTDKPLAHASLCKTRMPGKNQKSPFGVNFGSAKSQDYFLVSPTDKGIWMVTLVPF